MAKLSAFQLVVFVILSAAISWTQGSNSDLSRLWGKSPLPVFTRVEAKHNATAQSVHIKVFYKANERPDYRWHIDDVPFVGGMGDYFLHNHYDGFLLCMTSLIVPDHLGTRFAVCLRTPDAQNCLHLRPLPWGDDELNEDVEFPWPLLAPSPRARYESGEKTRIMAPELDTYDYNYSGHFFYLEPGQVDLKMAEFHGMQEAGLDNGVVTMRPVTFPYVGWLIEVATDVKGVEGLILFQTTIQPPQWASGIVERCISTRPLHIYNEDHQGPFPNSYVSMLPHSGHTLPMACRPQSNLFCLIACPFAINGEIYDTEIALSRVIGEGESRRVVPMTRTSLFGLAKKTGKYTAEAVFTLNVSDEAEEGLYQCSVTLAGATSSTLISLTIL